jgi:sarcosine oxidase subunit beta
MRGVHADVIVIGGGLHGYSSAFHLARKHAEVILLESDYCGRHASGVNAGGVRTLGRPLAEIPLALASRELWHELPDLVGDDVGFVADGQLKVAESDEDIAILTERTALLRQHGWTHETLVDHDTVRALVPSITPNVRGGIWVERDGYAMPYRAVTAFRRAAQQLGVHVHENSPAVSIKRVGNSWQVTTSRKTYYATTVINASGAWAGQLARLMGEQVPVVPTGLMLMITERIQPFIRPVLGATARSLSFKQFGNGTVLIGGALRCESVDVDAKHAELDIRRLANSARIVTELFPFLQGVSMNRAWSGIEAFTPDELPVIGPSSVAPGLFHAFGFCGSGFQLGPIVGQLMAELILDGQPTLSLEKFAVDRFRN